MAKPFTPRRAQFSYVRQSSSGAYFYRRAIPTALRPEFGGQAQFYAALTGRTDAERQAEAQALAHHHTRLLQDVAAGRHRAVHQLDLREVATLYSGPLWRGGEVRHVEGVAVADRADVRAEVEAAGRPLMSWDEERLQRERAEFARVAVAETATPTEPRMAARLTLAVGAEIDAKATPGGDLILDVAERWFSVINQGRETRRHHLRNLCEFIAWSKARTVQVISTRMVAGFIHHLTTQSIATGAVVRRRSEQVAPSQAPSGSLNQTSHDRGTLNVNRP